MTKKDYAMLAEVIACQFRDSFEDSKPVIRGLTYALATRLAWDNPRFDRGKFLRACGVLTD